MEPREPSPDGVSPAAPRPGLWRALVSASRGEAASSAQDAVGSVEGVGAGDQRRPFAELSPEEQADRRREAARKAAATRARNRARQAAEAKAKAEAPAVEPDAVEPEAVEPEIVEAEAVEPEAVEPDADAAEVAGPEAADPEAAEPEVIEAEVAEREVVEAEAVDATPEPEPAAAGDDTDAETAVEPDPETADEPEPDAVVEPEPEHEPEPEPEPAAEASEPTVLEESAALDEPEEPIEVVGVQSDPEATTTVARTDGDADDDDERIDAVPSVPATASDVAAPADADATVVLRLDGVTRRFGQTTAVEDVTIEVRAGECVGIVGPNGAGKSTTVSLAGGLMRATSGAVQVGGTDVHAKGAQALLGVVPDRMRLFDRLTGRQLLVHAALLRRVPRKDAIARAATLLERFDLTPDADRLVSDYSIGMQQLVGIAAALIHAPKVVVLDEPFESIDPVATDTILAVLADLRRRGGAVVLTSHDMHLVERACDHVVVLQDGVVRASGSLDDVRDGLSLEDRFTRLVGSSPAQELPWLSPSLG